MVEYFDKRTQSKKKRDFGYGAMNVNRAEQFLKLQQGNAARDNSPPPKMVAKDFQGERHSDTMKKEGSGVGVKPKPSPEQKLEDQQKYDQKEIDKNKPSEKKTKKPEKEVKYVKFKEDDRYHKKIGARSGLDHGRIPGY
tara:strand:+ start:1613 stop:2029 length:417 start_codon:yes stop_codon:yes gene_type:complete